MALIAFWCKWLGDRVGRFLRSFSDSFGDEIQSLLVVDEDGDRAGTPSNPSPATVGGATEIVQVIHDDLNANGNMQVGEVDVAADNPVPIEEQSVAPTAGLNRSYALNYTANLLTQTDMMIGVTTYRKMFSYSGSVWDAASEWAVV